MSRAEWQLDMRSRAEMRRVPIFAVILAVFGEWTPLVVMFATPIVPYNCRIPRQIRKSREKQHKRRSQSFRGAYPYLSGPQTGQSHVPKPTDVEATIKDDTVDIAPDWSGRCCGSPPSLPRRRRNRYTERANGAQFHRQTMPEPRIHLQHPRPG